MNDENLGYVEEYINCNIEGVKFAEDYETDNDNNNDTADIIVPNTINNSGVDNNINKCRYYCVEFLTYPLPAWINICIFIGIIIVVFLLKWLNIY
jgi:hypothetical protein